MSGQKINVNVDVKKDNILVVKPLETNEIVHKVDINENLPQVNFLLYVCAVRQSGKTTLIQYLLTEVYKGVFHKIFFFCPSLSQSSWDMIDINPERVYTDYTNEIFDNVVNEIKYNSDGQRCLIVIDDMTGNKIYNHNSSLEKFSYIHRHFPKSYGTSIIFVSHKYKSIPNGIRINMSDLIFFSCASNTELKVVTEDNSDRLSAINFKRLYRACTAQKYNFFYIKRSEPIETRFRHNFNEILKLTIVEEDDE